MRFSPAMDHDGSSLGRISVGRFADKTQNG